MTSDIKVRYWEGEKPPILVEADKWECFLSNESLNPMINWLNLYREDIAVGNACEGMDKINSVMYVSVKGILMIKTNRDVVFLNREQQEKLVAWLNEHRKLLSIREINAW